MKLSQLFLVVYLLFEQIFPVFRKVFSDLFTLLVQIFKFFLLKHKAIHSVFLLLALFSKRVLVLRDNPFKLLSLCSILVNIISNVVPLPLELISSGG
jgi:hypothetical protein